MPVVDLVAIIVDLAAARHLAIIDYRKPVEKRPSRRWVEPYKLIEGHSAFMVRAYQVRSEPKTSDPGWRHFRADRIEGVADSGEAFTPRSLVTLDRGELHPFRRPEEYPELDQPKPEQAYSDYVSSITMDGILASEEFNRALELQENMNPLGIRAAHAAVYAGLLTAMIVDGQISEHEQHHLRDVRKCLGQLGWEP